MSSMSSAASPQQQQQTLLTKLPTTNEGWRDAWKQVIGLGDYESAAAYVVVAHACAPSPTEEDADTNAVTAGTTRLWHVVSSLAPIVTRFWARRSEIWPPCHAHYSTTRSHCRAFQFRCPFASQSTTPRLRIQMRCRIV